MLALVYLGPHKKALLERPMPIIIEPTDVIVRVTKTTICNTDLHILAGHLPSCTIGRVLGHEGVGVVTQIGAGVTRFKCNDRVVISCITACGTCEFCRQSMFSQCCRGGWLLGNRIDGTQAEFVRVPYADTSLHHIPDDADDEALVMLSDALPTAYECGILNGQVKSGSTIAIIGAGPVGLAVLLAARLQAPLAVVVIDNNTERLATAMRLGATAIVDNRNGQAIGDIMHLTGGRGVDSAVDAIGLVATFELCEEIIAVGGTITTVGVHGTELDLYKEYRWDRCVTITTASVDTTSTPLLLEMLLSRRIDVAEMITHRFPLRRVLDAYATFADTTGSSALKIIIESAAA